jgi:hypothetical protein
MRSLMFDPIPTFADDDLGGSMRATPVHFPPSRQRRVLRDQLKHNMPVVVNPPSWREWATKCAIASDDESVVPVVGYVHWGDLTIAEGQAIIDCRIVAALTDGAISQEFTPPASTEAQRFLDTIRQNISEDSADLVREGGAAPTQATIDACVSVASNLSGLVVLRSAVKYAAFVEEEGGISLVLQSEVTNRRVNFRVSRSGTALVVVTVDADGRTASIPTRLDDAQTLRGWVEWLSQSR